MTSYQKVIGQCKRRWCWGPVSSPQRMGACMRRDWSRRPRSKQGNVRFILTCCTSFYTWKLAWGQRFSRLEKLLFFDVLTDFFFLRCFRIARSPETRGISWLLSEPQACRKPAQQILIIWVNRPGGPWGVYTSWGGKDLPTIHTYMHNLWWLSQAHLNSFLQ